MPRNSITIPARPRSGRASTPAYNVIWPALRHGHCIIALFCLVLSVCAFAEQTPPVQPKITETPIPPAIELPAPANVPDDVPNRPLTADEAVQIGLRYQSSIKIAKAGMSAASGRVQSARSGMMPSLALGAGHTSINSNGTQVGGGSSTGGGGPEGYQFTGLARQLLFDFNHARDLVRETTAEQSSAKHNVTRVESDLAFQIKQAFYNYAQNARLVQVNEDNVKNRQGHLDLAQARLNSGVGLPSDVVRAETARAEAILGLNIARTNASISRVQLAQLMGIDPRTPILAGDTEEPAVPADDADALITQALEERPEVLQSKASLEAAGHKLNAARTNGAPSLEATAGWNQRGVTPVLESHSFSVGLAVTWRAVDSGETAGLVREAAANVQTANAQAESAKLAVITDVSQAFLNLKTAEQRVTTSDAEVSNATEALRLTAGRYRSGLGTFIEVLDAQNALLSAQTNRVNSMSAVNLARSALVHAVGGSMPTQTAAK